MYLILCKYSKNKIKEEKHSKKKTCEFNSIYDLINNNKEGREERIKSNCLYITTNHGKQ